MSHTPESAARIRERITTAGFCCGGAGCWYCEGQKDARTEGIVVSSSSRPGRVAGRTSR